MIPYALMKPDFEFFIFRDFSRTFVVNFLLNSGKWPNLSGNRSKFFEKKKKFKIRLHQRARYHKISLKNKNGGFGTYQCWDFFLASLNFWIFGGHFPILKGKNTQKGAKSVTSLLGRRCIFSNSVKSFITPIIQILRCVKIKEFWD